jgi:hypothetical protein
MQAHLASRPQLLLSLLYRIISLQKQQLWFDGRQTLQQFKVQLLLSLQQQPQQQQRGVRSNMQQQQQYQWTKPLWSQLLEVLQYQAVLQLFGAKYFWRHAGSPVAAMTRIGSNDGSSGSSDDGFGGRLSVAYMQRLAQGHRLPYFQCSFKVLFLLLITVRRGGGATKGELGLLQLHIHYWLPHH